jgi:aldose 1-epimerase
VLPPRPPSLHTSTTLPLAHHTSSSPLLPSMLRALTSQTVVRALPSRAAAVTLRLSTPAPRAFSSPFSRALSAARAAAQMEASTSAFGLMPDGRRVDKIRLSNPSGVTVDLVTYGATVVSVRVPSKPSQGTPEEVTLCHADLDKLRTASPYYGCTVGRFANRIAKGRFSVDGKDFAVATNNGANALHGGVVGFDKVLWTPRVFATADAAGVAFSYTAHDGEEGYPGELTVTATYSLSSTNELTMDFSATTTAATPVNLCNHTYWNLSGGLKAANVYDHVLQLNCPAYLPIDATSIPTGVIAPVAGTAMDFTSPRRVGERLQEVDGGGKPGYDHCYARTTGAVPKEGLGMGVIAVLSDPASGRTMTVSTNAPGVQLYTGNYLDGPAPHDQHHALCLETQGYPDCVNQTAKGFPDPILRPGETYKHVAVHKFEW